MNLAVLNALLNAILYIAHAIIALLVQRIYVCSAKVQLAKTGSTHATDSGETSLLRCLWRRWRNGAEQTTPGFAIALGIAMFALLPAELLLESGIDIDQKCKIELQNSTNGVCASPWEGWSIARSSAMALLVYRYKWLDEEWDFVRQGASKSFWANEVHSLERSKLRKAKNARNVRFLAKNCRVELGVCTGCGHIFAIYRDGPFGMTAVNSTWLYRRFPRSFCQGDVMFDGVFGSSYMFCTDELRTPLERPNKDTVRVAVKGIETVLSQRDEREFMKFLTTPWPIALKDNNTRIYDIACDTDGLTAEDFTKAIASMRVVQLEMSGLDRRNLRHSVHKLEPLNRSDVVKAVFAMKAEDTRSTCTAQVEVYRECATLKWERALFFLALASALVLTWAVAIGISSRYQDIDVPHDSVTWRKYAYKHAAEDGIEDLDVNRTSEEEEEGSGDDVVALENPSKSRDRTAEADGERKCERRSYLSIGMDRGADCGHGTVVCIDRDGGRGSSRVFLSRLERAKKGMPKNDAF